MNDSWLVVTVLRPKKHQLRIGPLSDSEWRKVSTFIDGRKDVPQTPREFSLCVVSGEPASVDHALALAAGLTASEGAATIADREAYSVRVANRAVMREQQRHANRAPGGSWDRSCR